ncbi:MAG: hypothetical protein AAF360_02010 [Pseudomonadota bacterium]
MALGAKVGSDERAPSKYGADDKIGAASLIRPHSVAPAAKLAANGKTLPLAIVFDPRMLAFQPRKTPLQVVLPGQPGQQGGETLEGGFG